MQKEPFKIAALGEVLWDVFESGPRFGGAPANFACSAAAIAVDRAQVQMLSAVGKDSLGTEALSALHQHGVGTDYVQIKDYPTGQVNITVDNQGIASYEFAANCAWDNLQTRPADLDLATKLSTICFGTLGQRSATSKQAIQDIVAATSADALRIFDINLRQPFFDRATVQESLELANVLKLNDAELPIIAEWFELTGTEDVLLRACAERWKLQAVALTRGERGALILRGEELHDCPGIQTKVVDTVGAGDAYTARLALGLLDDEELPVINRQACKLAAFVCSQPGANPQLGEEFRV